MKNDARTPPFHLAFPVRDLPSTERFFVDVLGCRVGRRSERWIDFDFWGHQISAHVRPEELRDAHTNEVDGDAVPVRHFGVVLTMEQWRELATRLQERSVEFLIEPHVRFEGETGEQATMFVKDPSGNALEFKAFADMDALFES